MTFLRGGGIIGPAQSFPTPIQKKQLVKEVLKSKVEDLFDISHSKVFRYSERVQLTKRLKVKVNGRNPLKSQPNSNKYEYF